MYASQSDNIHI